jgi:hypothetical protein
MATEDDQEGEIENLEQDEAEDERGVQEEGEV